MKEVSKKLLSKKIKDNFKENEVEYLLKNLEDVKEIFIRLKNKSA